jgi:fructose-bisphosphate aldolase class I
MNAAQVPRPWRVSFSYGRALQDPALAAWGGQPARAPAGQRALSHRARCNGAAAMGRYDESMEAAKAEMASAGARSSGAPHDDD